MSNSRAHTMLLVGLMIVAIVCAGCTRAASTPPADEEAAAEPVDSQQATMEAVRAALLTQTAEAGEAAPEATEAPTEAPTAEESPLPGAEATEEVEEFVEYTVKAGDWIFKIAESFGVDPQDIVDLNELSSPSQIVVGMVLKIPPSTGEAPSAGEATLTAGGVTHVVQSGEWIWQIARQYGVNPQDIIDANDLADPGLIYPGMEIVIP